MSVINYVSGNRYVLLIVNQIDAAIWGATDALLSGYRVRGPVSGKTSALEDVFVFPSIDKCLKMVQEYVDLQAEVRADQVAEGGDFANRYVAVSAGPINDLKDAQKTLHPLDSDNKDELYMWFDRNYMEDELNELEDKCDGHSVTKKITYPVKQVTPQIKEYVMERSEAGLATQGHITLWSPDKDLDSRRQDIRLYEWLIIPVRGEE